MVTVTNMRSYRPYAWSLLALACSQKRFWQALAQSLELPKLPYEYNGLEPAIDEATMRVHHLGHHAAYLKTINNALTTLRSEESTKHLAKMGVDRLLQHIDEVPKELQNAVRNGGGGFVNHALFWEQLTPTPGKEEPAETGLLGSAIKQHFGSFVGFKEKFSNAAVTLFGSGWAWLVYDASTDALVIETTVNQNTPAMTKGKVPILGLDVWEHAYYLKYQNRRQEYVENFFTIINWEVVAKRHQEAKAKGKQEL